MCNFWYILLVLFFNSTLFSQNTFLVDNDSIIIWNKDRKLFQTLQKENSIYDEYESAYEKINEELFDYQKLYDFETNSSRNKLAQKEWKKKVHDELLEYDMSDNNPNP